MTRPPHRRGAGGRPILFVSDAHFGDSGEESEKERLDRFIEFLRFAAGRAEILYIVGDLFDFWFEYKQVLPRTHIRILSELAAVAREGLEILYIAGNHDFWIGEFFTRHIGIGVSHEPLTLEVQGRTIYVTHGDELTAGHDPGYRFLRRLVRSRFAIGAYHWIHPDIGIPFARWGSHMSRGYTTRKKFVLNKTLETAIRRKLQGGVDGIVMGHIHYADHLRYETGECIMLGDWIHSFTYAELDNGTFRLARWDGSAGA